VVARRSCQIRVTRRIVGNAIHGHDDRAIAGTEDRVIEDGVRTERPWSHTARPSAAGVELDEIERESFARIRAVKRIRDEAVATLQHGVRAMGKRERHVDRTPRRDPRRQAENVEGDNAAESRAVESEAKRAWLRASGKGEIPVAQPRYEDDHSKYSDCDEPKVVCHGQPRRACVCEGDQASRHRNCKEPAAPVPAARQPEPGRRQKAQRNHRRGKDQGENQGEDFGAAPRESNSASIPARGTAPT
jgi:hypothetical protein